MAETVIDGVDDLYGRLVSHTLDPMKHAPFMGFFIKARTLNDPNECSCKKGKKSKDEVHRLYLEVPLRIRNEPHLSMAKSLLGGDVLIFRSNGVEFSRIG